MPLSLPTGSLRRHGRFRQSGTQPHGLSSVRAVGRPPAPPTWVPRRATGQGGTEAARRGRRGSCRPLPARGRWPPGAEQQGRAVMGTKPLAQGLACRGAGGASPQSRVQPLPWSRIEAQVRGSRLRRKGRRLGPPAARATCVPSHGGRCRERGREAAGRCRRRSRRPQRASHGTRRMPAAAGTGLRAAVHGGPRGGLKPPSSCTATTERKQRRRGRRTTSTSVVAVGNVAVFHTLVLVLVPDFHP